MGYVDAYFVGDTDTRKSTTLFMFTLVGNCSHWKSGLQSTVTLSIIELEYVAISKVLHECVWLMGITGEAKIADSIGSVFTDSRSALYMCKNLVYHGRSKHISVKIHYVCDKVFGDKVKLLKKILF